MDSVINISASGSLNQIRDTGTLVCQSRRPFPLLRLREVTSEWGRKNGLRNRGKEHVCHHKARCLLFAAFCVPVYVWVRNVQPFQKISQCHKVRTSFTGWLTNKIMKCVALFGRRRHCDSEERSRAGSHSCRQRARNHSAWWFNMSHGHDYSLRF